MQSCLSVDQEKQDQRKKIAMENTTTMTIEFLRARLLSERSVSRTAKQRADDLAKRVVELEEQLKIVTLQRKKAEKATVEVLSILENNGIGDLETFDSNSDQEGVHCESKEDSNFTKDEESSMTSRQRRNEEQMSGSELEGSSLSGRSLSWKSCPDSLNSLGKKYIDQATRRRCSFVSTGDSSAKPRMGKSCRQIKRRETISADDNIGDESILVDAQDNRVDAGLGNTCNCYNDRLEILKKGFKNKEDAVSPEELVPGSPEDQCKEINEDDFNGCGRDAEMERAIENNAQLIDQYEAEENAQREWEEKFRENSSCTPDSCELGNRSDITEEMDEMRETAESAGTIPSLGKGATSEVEEGHHVREPKANTLSNDLSTTCLGMGCSEDQQCDSALVNEAQTSFPNIPYPNQESPRSSVKGKQIQVWSDTPSHGSSGHHSKMEFSSCHGDVSPCNGESSRSQNELQMAVWHEPSNGLGGVLEALQRAKFSLKHELNRLPFSSQSWPVMRMTETPLPAIKPEETMEIPPGCAGLFRVPTDSHFQATPQPNLFGPYTDSGLSLTSYYPNAGVAGNDRYTTTSSNSVTGLTNSTQKPFDPYLDVGMALTASSRYTYPSYADLVPRMPFNGVHKPYSRIGPDVVAGDLNSAYYDQIRSNKYHQL